MYTDMIAECSCRSVPRSVSKPSATLPPVVSIALLLAGRTNAVP